MKPPKFHVGQAVTPIKLPARIHKDATFRIKMGAIYTVNDVLEGMYNGRRAYYIGCEEWPFEECCVEDFFAPAELLPAEALAELLEEVFTPVHA